MVHENVCMIASLSTKRISAISQWNTFIRVLPTRWRRKPASIEITSLSPYVHGSLGPAQSPSKILIGSAALAQLMVMFNRETDTSRPRNGKSVTIGRIFALRACDAAEDFWLLKAYGVFTRCNRRSDRWRNRRRDRSHVCLHEATVGAIIGATIGAIVGATGRADSWMSVQSDYELNSRKKDSFWSSLLLLTLNSDPWLLSSKMT